MRSVSSSMARTFCSLTTRSSAARPHSRSSTWHERRARRRSISPRLHPPCVTRTSMASTCRPPESSCGPAAGELVAAGRTVEQVQRKIGADWLVYQDLDDLVQAVHHEKADIEGFDTSCFSGEYVTGDVSRAYLDTLEIVRSNSAKAKRDAKVRAEESEDDTIQVASGL